MKKTTFILSTAISTFTAITNADISHQATVSTIQSYAASADPAYTESWSWFQLSGLTSVSGCPSADEGAGNLAYVAVSGSESFMESVVLSAYLSGQEVDVLIDDINYYQGKCQAKQVALVPPEGGSAVTITSNNHPNLQLLVSFDSETSGVVDDSSSNSYSGSFVGNTTLSSGVFGSAVEFDGSGDTVLFGDIMNEIFAGVDKKFSFSFWANTAGSSGNKALLSKTGGTAQSENERTIYASLNNNKLLFSMMFTNNSGNNRNIESTTPILLNQWVHCVITYDGSINTNDGHDRVTMYVDNVLQQSNLVTSNGILSDIPPSESHFSISGMYGKDGPLSHEFDGKIDQFRVFNKVLTDTEVAELYNETP